MKNQKHTIIILVTMLLIAMLLVSCGSKKPKQGSLDVYLGGNVIEKNDSILVEGESNLLENSRLTGEVITNDGEVLSDTSEVVDKKGDFMMEMDHHNYGEAEVVVTFDLVNSAQEEEVVEHYGKGGEKLDGSYAYVSEHWEVNQVNRKAEIRLSLKADNDESKHAFKEPDWDKRPDDYGESRVWFEVDDITNDSDYFYLNGKTNLLDGSLISGSYSEEPDVAETRINPDGSFEMEIEYRYSEDPYFVIKFNPSGQWESIRKNYGFDGEKLVGQNITSTGNNLSVEEKVEYEHD